MDIQTLSLEDALKIMGWSTPIDDAVNTVTPISVVSAEELLSQEDDTNEG